MTTYDKRKSMAQMVIWSFHGRPYIYGGNSPLGVDCSGFTGEVMRSIGLLRGDLSAQGQYDHFAGCEVGTPESGCLAFFGKSRKDITHVAWCLNEDLMMEAGGGDEDTKTIEDARRKDACVRLRPICSRRDLVVFVNPFMKEDV